MPIISMEELTRLTTTALCTEPFLTLPFGILSRIISTIGRKS